MKDINGTPLNKGDIVIYTTSSRYAGLIFAVIKSTLETKKQRYILAADGYRPTVSTFNDDYNMFKISENTLPLKYHDCLYNIRKLLEGK